MQVVFASHNPGKIAECNAILGAVGVDVLSAAQVPELASFDVEETGATFQENALLKAQQSAEKMHGIVLADDSGLEVAALNGLPGVHSKRFIEGTDHDRCQEILKRLAGQTNRKAQFVTVLCLYNAVTKKAEYFTGILPGHIGTEERGTHGFGYDPLFIPEGHTQTLAELGLELKNQISHRARAFAQLKEYLHSTTK